MRPSWNTPFVSESPRDTHRAAHWLIEEIDGAGIVALWGELGSGKTCFVQGMALALGIARPVTSPTFTIVNEYREGRSLYHIDFYRIGSADEALALGFDEYLEQTGVIAIEWPERIGSLLAGHEVVDVHLTILPTEDRRQISVRRHIAPPGSCC